jgi:hypothetical protein
MVVEIIDICFRTCGERGLDMELGLLPGNNIPFVAILFYNTKLSW